MHISELKPVPDKVPFSKYKGLVELSIISNNGVKCRINIKLVELSIIINDEISHISMLTFPSIHLLQATRSDLTQEAGQLKSFVDLGKDLSKSGTLTNTQSLLDTTKDVSDEFNLLQANVNNR